MIRKIDYDFEQIGQPSRITGVDMTLHWFGLHAAPSSSTRPTVIQILSSLQNSVPSKGGPLFLYWFWLL